MPWSRHHRRPRPRPHRPRLGGSLKRPTKLHGLIRTGKIHVIPCEVTGSTNKNDVGVQYGKVSTGVLTLDRAALISFSRSLKPVG